MYLVCETKEELAEKLKHYQETIRVFDEKGNDMRLKGFDVDAALELGPHAGQKKQNNVNIEKVPAFRAPDHN